MATLFEKHQRFLHFLLKSARYEEQYPVSSIPTYNFYIGAVFLSYIWCHNRTRPYTRWRLWAARELTFQWLLFYAFRLWIFAIHWLRILIMKTKSNILNEPEDSDDKSLWLGCLGVTICILLSFTPYIIICVCKLTSETGQNFFVWLGDDPWLRSEIGVAGHYLMRPPNTQGQPKNHCAYRIRRSCSLNDLCDPKAEMMITLNNREGNPHNSKKRWHSDNNLRIRIN